jgi:hypothetical protein
LDGDNDNDLAVSNRWSNNVSVLLNNGNGKFQTAVNYPADDQPVSVSADDLDNDGDNDLSVANYNSNNVSILFNNGDGTFTPAVNYAAGDGTASHIAVDLDGDNFIDLAVANFTTSNISFLKNNGDSTFQTAVNYGTAVNSISLCAADFDGDNDYDLAVSNYGSENISIIENLAIISDVDNYPETYLPENFSISQNYPNPFNPETKIRYSVPQSSNVILKVFDVLGSEIETLVNEEKGVGTYEVNWSAENLTSGIYFYRLQAGDFVETKKMVLMK